MAQSELIAKNTPTTAKQFSFVLNNATQGSLTLAFAPDGWEDDEYIMTRDMKSFGVFRKFAAAEMKFVKDGRDYVQDVYEADGVNADCTFTVTEMPPSGTSRTRFVGKLDFSTYKITELSADIQVIDGAFTDLILTRAKTDVNILGGVAVSGVYIGGISKDDITIPEIFISQVGAWGFVDQVTHSDAHAPYMLEQNNEWPESATVSGSQPAFFIEAVQDYPGVVFSINLKGIIDCVSDCSIMVALNRHDQNGFIEGIDSVTYSFQSIDNTPFDWNLSTTFDINTGESLILLVSVTDGVDTVYITYSDINATLTQDAESIPSRIIKGLTYHEAFDRLVQHYTGLTSRFKSDFFGTIAGGYTADGEALGVVTTGRDIRQKTAYNDTLPVSLESLFTSLQSIYCIGLGIETISNVEKVVIEPMAHFFDDAVIIDISDRIAEETIEKQVAADLIYNRISVGYNSYDYGRLGGIYEFNTTSKFTNVIKPVDKELQIVAPYRADMSGVLSIIKEPVENRDVSGEKDIFILDTINSSGFVVRTTEGFDSSDNFGNKDILLNLLITPARNLYRWGSYIRGWLDKYSTTNLTWQTSDKNTKLTTTLTGGTALNENADVLVSDLSDPLWHPETFTIEVPALEADITAIKNNPYGLIKITATEYGWLLNYKSKNENKKSEFKLLRCNTTYITPEELPS